MARPIEPTPPVTGQDAERLLESLDTGASPAEMRERADRAQRVLASMATGSGLFSVELKK